MSKVAVRSDELSKFESPHRRVVKTETLAETRKVQEDGSTLLTQHMRVHYESGRTFEYFVDRKEAKEKPKKSVAPAAAAAGLEPVGDDAQ